MAFIERLIAKVKKNPILFDNTHPQYKHIRKKTKIWNEIGAEFNETGDEIKRKWKNIRDTYSKYIRRGRIVKRKYRHWQWAKEMETFRPFMSIALNEPNLNEKEMENVAIKVETQEVNERENRLLTELPTEIQDFVIKAEPLQCNEDDISLEPLTEITIIESPVVTPTPVNNLQINEGAKNSSNLENKHGSNADATELIFKGYAQIVNSFSLRRQAVTRMEIAKIIMQQELEHQEEVSSSSSKPSSIASDFLPSPYSPL